MMRWPGHTRGGQGLGQRRRIVEAAAIAVAGLGAVAGLCSTAGAAQHTYTPAGDVDQWDAGTNWSSTPVSGIDTQLTIVGNNATVLPDGQVSTTNNNFPGNFLLNILDLQGTGPAATDATVHITGNPLEFVASSGAALPVINLNANDGAQDLDYVVANNLTLGSNVTVAGDGTAGFTFSGAIGGSASLTKTGLSTLVLSGVNNYTGGTSIQTGSVLRATQTASLPGYNIPGNIVLTGRGATLAVNAGGAGEWTSTDVDTLRANVSIGMGQHLGLHVDSSFTYGSNINGQLGIWKTGGGTLALTGNNTYSGFTSLTGGTLTSTQAVNIPTHAGNAGVFVENATLRLTAGTANWTSPQLNTLIAKTTFNPGANLTLDVTDAASISSNIGQSAALTKTGAGTLTLSGTNSYTGNTALQAGTLAVTNGAQLGSGTLNLANASVAVTLQTTAASAAITNPVVNVDANANAPMTLNAAGAVEFTGTIRATEGNVPFNINSPGLTTFSGPFHTSDSANVRNLRFGGNGNVLISGVISNGTAGSPTGGIGNNGSGKLTLTGNNTWAGNLFLGNGIISISSGANLGAARIQFGESTTLASPTLEVTGAGPLAISNNIAVRSLVAAPGILSAARPIDFTGTMTSITGTGLLLINNSSTTTFSGAVAISDGSANRTLRLGGTGDVLITAPVTNATSGSVTGSLGYFGTGTLTLTNNNSYGGTTTVASGTVAIGNNGALGTGPLNLGSSSSAPATIRAEGAPRTVANNVTLSSSQLNPGRIAGDQDLTLTGSFSNGNSDGYLEVTNTADTTLAGPVFLSSSTANARNLHITGPGDLLISGAIANANGAGLPGAFEHDGAGTVTLTGINTYTGGTRANSGTLQVRRMHENNAVTIAAGAKLQVLDSSPTLPDHPSGDNAFVSRPSSLTIAAGGQLDLGNNDLIIDYTTTSPIADIEALVASGFNGGEWNGDGIISTTALNDPNFVLAVAENALLLQPFGDGVGDDPLFAGQVVDDTTVLVKFTHRVDLDLDGLITGNDAAVFNAFFNEGQPATWQFGDLDYDGVYSGNDAAIFNGFYNESLASVPEPTFAGVLGVAAMGLLLPRQRRR